jgi:hypothetical protein
MYPEPSDGRRLDGVVIKNVGASKVALAFQEHFSTLVMAVTVRVTAASAELANFGMTDA